MLFFVCVVLTFSAMGYAACLFVNKHVSQWNGCDKGRKQYIFRNSIHTTHLGDSVDDSVDHFFDHTTVTIGEKTSRSLEDIFDLISENYINPWYNLLSSNPDFLIQLKINLQYLCASLIERGKSISLADFIVYKLIPHFIDHINHVASVSHLDAAIYSMNATHTGQAHRHGVIGDDLLEINDLSGDSTSRYATSLSDEEVLRSFGDHLHSAVYSRKAEISYLRALVIHLLPYLGIPPSLLSYQTENTSNEVIDLSSPQASSCASYSSTFRRMNHCGRMTRSASNGTIFPSNQTSIRLGPNPAVCSLLIEIIATCVLLPAMDFIANSDFLNQLILACLSKNGEPVFTSTSTETKYVPVLNTYVEQWQKWLNAKPCLSLSSDILFRQQDELYPLMQYVKSVKSTKPFTVILLMYQINSRLSGLPVNEDIGREITAQIRHILELLSSSKRLIKSQMITNNKAKDNKDSSTNGGNEQCIDKHLKFLGITEGFVKLLQDNLGHSEPQMLVTMIHTQQWQVAYRSAHEAIQSRYLPLYMESPEYIRHLFGHIPMSSSDSSINLINMSPTKRPRNQAQNPGSLGAALMNMLGVQSGDGQSVINIEPSPSSSNRRAHARDLRNDVFRPNSDDSSTNSNIKQILNTDQIDMSNWCVSIRGLTRPEILQAKDSSQRSLLSIITDAAVIPNNEQQSLHELVASTTATRDTDYKKRIHQELVNIRSSVRLSSAPIPQLSAQFMFNVLTERVSNGVVTYSFRVGRKYAEFYVLEQKLVEFHGSALTKSLPKRQFYSKKMEFLESKCDLFQDYLRYLLSQSFLKNSKLLYKFLTCNEPFTFEANFGRLMKSVPLRLTKEKGQNLNDFLIAYYASCHQSRIDPTTEDQCSDTAGSRPISSDVLGSQNLSTMNNQLTNSQQLHHRSVQCGQLSEKRQSTVDFGCSQFSLMNANFDKRSKPTMLDHRLRSNLYWNNAGLSSEANHRRRSKSNDDSAQFLTTKLNGALEILIYLFDKLITPPPDFAVNELKQTDHNTNPRAGHQHKQLEKVSSVSCHSSTSSSVSLLSVSQGTDSWNEALLNAPTLPYCFETDNELLCDQELEPHSSNKVESVIQSKTNNSSLSMQSSSSLLNNNDSNNVNDNGINDQNCEINISWSDVCIAMNDLRRLIWLNLRHKLCEVILSISTFLANHFTPIIDSWLLQQFNRYLYSYIVNDQNIAHVVDNVKEHLFLKSPSKVVVDRSAQQAKAREALENYILESFPAIFADSRQLKLHIRVIFECFQHSKWNKQLTYVLLDQIVLKLFPELVQTTIESDSLSETTV